MSDQDIFLSQLEELNMSQGDFATLAGIHRSTITQWIHHRVNGVPKWAVVLLDCKIDRRKVIEEIDSKINELEALVFSARTEGKFG